MSAHASHRIYREPMRAHLHHITLRHWDKNMRVLGARALRELVQLGGSADLSDAIEREVRLDYRSQTDTRSLHCLPWILTVYMALWWLCVS